MRATAAAPTIATGASKRAVRQATESANRIRSIGGLKLDFDTSVAGHDPRTAAVMGVAATLAYESEASLRAQLKLRGFTDVAFFSDPLADGQAFIASNGKQTLVAFRGTSSTKDFVVDASAAMVPAESWGGGQVHSGFFKAFSALWPRMLPEIEARRAQGQAVVLTGHSLGGALATLAAAELHREGKDPDLVYTFGSPRVGDARFAQWYDQGLRDRTFRYVNNSDAVARVPRHSGTIAAALLSAELGDSPYVHVGQLHYIDRNRQVIAYPSFDDSNWHTAEAGVIVKDRLDAFREEVQRQSKRLVTGKKVKLGAAGRALITDHFMEQYMRVLRHSLSNASGAKPRKAIG